MVLFKSREGIMKKLSTKNLKIAIPNKGRLSEPSLKILSDAGLSFETHNRGLFSSCTNFDIDILYVRAADIPEYVKDNVVDLGITGNDLLIEKLEENSNDVNKILNLGFGGCSLKVAVPQDSKLQDIKELSGKKIATSYPNIAKRYFKSENIDIEIIEVSGAVEITTSLGVADAILDIVSTGSTMKINLLRPLKTVMKSESILIENKNNNGNKKDLKEQLASMLQSVIYGREKRYIMLNATEEILAKIKKEIPGLTSPTIINLAKPGHIAVHSVVDADLAWEISEKLRGIGATGILVIPIEKIIP